MTAPTIHPAEARFPLMLRRYLTHLVIQRVLSQHEGWAGVLTWLYAGTVREGSAARIPYAATSEYLIPIATAEAESWERARKAHAA